MVDFFLGITNKCNLNCPWCAHYKLRMMNESYEMSKEEFEKWYQCTKKSGYFFESIDFNGLGEPTLYTDIDFLCYMLIKCREFTNEINVLTNGTRQNIIKKILPLCDNINVSVWTKLYNYETISPQKIHMRKNIQCHDMRKPVSSMGKIGNDIICGCSGCGYTMNIVFLVCGTWCPEIRIDNLYHTNLRPYYLSTLDENYGKAAYPMCRKCWANTSIPYALWRK